MDIPREQPNILFIMPDQMRGDCMSLAGHPALITPNIDNIGHSGTHFTSCYSTCTSCIAARRSLLTGQHPATHGVVGYREGIRITGPTLPQQLTQAGYHTAVVGRYMHQSPYEESYGFKTRILGSIHKDGDDYARFLERHKPESGGLRSAGLSWNGCDANPWPFEEWLHPTNWTVRESRELIGQQDADQPLFLMTSFYNPHPPLFPPAFFMERYLRMDLPDPAIGDWAVPPPNNGIGLPVHSPKVNLTGERLRSAQAGYFGLIDHIGTQLYWLISDFTRKSQADRRPWMIVFTSDHGEMLGDHYYFRKTLPYEGSARIPLLIQGSSQLGFRSGQSCERPVCLEDLNPTLLEVAGAEIPAGVEGVSLLPTLRGDQQVVREWVHSEHGGAPRSDSFHMLTDGKMKYVWNRLTGAEQLFDLCADRKECSNLASDPERQEELLTWRSRMVEHLKGRPEGFSDGERLIPGCPHPAALPFVVMV
ncbi:MAG: sulfatase-like hydrolase/transferase [Lentisphaerae bacterium]|jgi:arylsulfatase|nr:sulfatase-like hydrolase/transferase [Lentisphaerota bacterium]MBT4814909.1 sulfatase-like hydrolase/transferase [Lentisphaerota bacterium]MBT5605444.1 sulfatase-like hydrolase/transferase [Lentisphaerota bacterium]MBT7060125.1 sulfatase-like hydrolase/transferase [Lentisphaerota bacterium]MBT7840815.1 sulfatase-like hydrolase/transferase [Lentisphaerota bacterium]